MGRFISQDPIGDGLNWYAYVGSSPVRYIDPEGEALVGAVVGALSGAAGGAVGAAAQGKSRGDIVVGAIIGGVIGGLIGAIDPTDGGLVWVLQGTTGFGRSMGFGALFGGVSGTLGNLAGQAASIRRHHRGRINGCSVAASGILGAASGAAGGFVRWAAFDVAGSRFWASAAGTTMAWPGATFGGPVWDALPGNQP